MDKNAAFEDLNYIKKIIADSKRTAIDNGIGFIFWGIVISTALFSNYVYIKIELYHWSTPTWIGLISFGWIYTIFDSIRCSRKGTPQTYASSVLGAVWVSLGIVMTIIGFIGSGFGAIKGVYLSGFMALQIGIGFFITAAVYKNTYMFYLAILWWIGAISMLIFPGLHVILQMGLMMIFLQVVPGIIIYRKYQQEKVIE